MKPVRPLIRPGWILYLAPALLSVVVAFYLGMIEIPPPAILDFNWGDKVGHLWAFALIQLTHARAASFVWPDAPPRRHAWIGFLTASAAGAALEVVQAFLPHRTAEFADLVADAVGAGLMALLYVQLKKVGWLRGERS